MHLVVEDVLKERFTNTAYATTSYLEPGKKASALTSGRLGPIHLLKKIRQKKRTPKRKQNQVDVMLEKLQRLRKEISQQAEVFPHHIMSEGDLQQLKEKAPKTKESLIEIIGKVKGEKYGEQIMTKLREIYEEPAQLTLSADKNHALVINKRKSQEKSQEISLVDSQDDAPSFNVDPLVDSEDDFEPLVLSPTKRSKS